MQSLNLFPLATSHSLIIATGLRDTDRSLFGFGRSSEGWKCR